MGFRNENYSAPQSSETKSTLLPGFQIRKGLCSTKFLENK
jgi:hypothetical protein